MPSKSSYTMRAQSIIAVLMMTSVQLWPVHADTVDIAAVAPAYASQTADFARKVVLRDLVKHPERLHHMSLKFTFKLDRQGGPYNVTVVSDTHNRWAEDTARRALAAAKFAPVPTNVIQNSATVESASRDSSPGLDHLPKSIRI